MSVITANPRFLATQTAVQLQRLAVATGVRVSGTKPVLISRLEKDVLPIGKRGTRLATKPAEMRILSLDMGIRNLAYAFLVTSSKTRAESLPMLTGWSRVVIAPNINGKSQANTESDASEGEPIPPQKEPFDPATYASHAYSLATSLLQRFRPTHILIERQRFRSGSSSAVQEWSLRVGVFEGMIYAVLETLKSFRKSMWNGKVVAIDPGKVARYWMASREASDAPVKSPSVKGKVAKVAIVRSWLESEEKDTVRYPSIELKGDDAVEVRETINLYLRSGVRMEGKKLPKGVGQTVQKLDDLADCLLQGIAWIQWGRAREVVAEKGWEGAVEQLETELKKQR